MKKKFSFKVFLFALLGIILIVVITFVFIFRNELSILRSIKTVSTAPAYELKYKGGFALDTYLEQGISDNDDQYRFILKNIAKGIGNFFETDQPHGCSAFFGKTPEGDLIFARNFDTPKGIGAVTVTDGTEGYRSILISQANWLGVSGQETLSITEKILLLATPYMVADGINEAGFSAAFFTANGTKTVIDETKVTLHDNTIISILLSRCATVEEAVHFLKQYNILMDSAYPSQYMLCDADGNSAIIEYIDGEMIVLDRDGDYQICTNFLLYDNPSLIGYGTDRYMNYDRHLKQTKGIISTTDALELLKENTIRGSATWSAVYNLTKKNVTVTFHKDYDNVMVYEFE